MSTINPIRVRFKKDHITFDTGLPDIVTDGLVLYLDAGNNNSYPGFESTWYDLSGNNNNGTLVNGVGFDIGNGGSLTFDGSNDYISVSNSSSLNPLNNTLICWAKSDNSTWNDTGFLMSKRNVFVMHPSGGSKVVNYYYYLNGGWQNQDVTPSDITIWNMYACTWDGTSISAYLNGSLINSGNKTGPLNTSDTGPMEIGHDEGFGGRYMDGNISQVSIYNRALTAQEIQQNFEALRGRYGI